MKQMPELQHQLKWRVPSYIEGLIWWKLKTSRILGLIKEDPCELEQVIIRDSSI